MRSRHSVSEDGVPRVFERKPLSDVRANHPLSRCGDTGQSSIRGGPRMRTFWKMAAEIHSVRNID